MEQLQTERRDRAILVGVSANQRHFDYSMEELGYLAEACGIEPIATVTQQIERANPTHYVGTGKLQEIVALVKETDADLVLFDDELTPSQIRNLEKDLANKVLDRTSLILDIFATRAQTKEAQLQVEVAQLQYRLPRLIGLRTSLGRQGGGAGLRNRGAGETKLELDRRKVEERIAALNDELEHLAAQRETKRKQRRKSGLPVVSLVGYTNAGKSTLMNAMLHSFGQSPEKRVLEKDMLFATLETSIRNIRLPDNKQFLLSDTVGFINKLPHHLVKAFRSTLEEAADADLLLHVIDYANPQHGQFREVTERTLEEIGVSGVPVIHVYNKCDLAPQPTPESHDDAVYVSALGGEGLDTLTGLIRDRVFRDYVRCALLVPYDRGQIVSYLSDNAAVLDTAYEEKGTRLQVELSRADYERYREFAVEQPV